MATKDKNSAPCSRIGTVEAWTLNYGIVISILTGGAIIFFLGFLIYLLATPDDRIEDDQALYLINLLFVTVSVLVMFLFSGLLIYGVCKKKHRFLLARFIFGAIESIVFIPGSIVLMAICLEGGCIGLFLSIPYLLPLIAVFKTYLKFRDLRFIENYQTCSSEISE